MGAPVIAALGHNVGPVVTIPDAITATLRDGARYSFTPDLSWIGAVTLIASAYVPIGTVISIRRWWCCRVAHGSPVVQSLRFL